MTGVLAGALGLVVGLVIGALGGGGGVLSVPALVYLLGQDARAATTGSIVIVGVVSAVGVLSRLRSRRIDWATGLGFGVVGVPAAWAGTLLNRSVPQPVLLMSFAVLTIAVAVVLLVRGSEDDADDADEAGEAAGAGAGPAGGATAVATRTGVGRVVRIVVSGAVVGVLTGFLGVGGGFLVVPALVIVLGLSMPAAIATSLLVLTVNAASSLGARAGDLDLDWAVLGPFVGVAVLAALAGKLVADRLSSAALGRGFAVLLLLVGAAVGVESVSAVL